jgi:hypothetical protein
MTSIIDQFVTYIYGTTATEPQVQDLAETVSEVCAEEEVQIKTLAESVSEISGTVFAREVSEKVYSYDELKKCGKELPFAKYSPQAPYSRRSDIVPSIYNASLNYHADLAERVIIQYLGKGGKTPMSLLREQLGNENPQALKVAAMLSQLGDDSFSFPDKVEEFRPLEGQINVISGQYGTIGLGERLNIRGDVVAVLSSENEIMRGYVVDRSVTFTPNKDNSVTCKIETTYQ